MRGALQNRIAPMDPKGPMELNNLKVKDAPQKSQSANAVDFKSVLLNSNQEVAQKRLAQKNGDLSSAESYEDFLQQLSDQTQAENAPKNTLGKDDFLKLFVTQLQNQDPLKPKDGTEMASQLAQFNGLEQMMNVNTTLERMEQAEQTNSSHQFINYIGKEITLTDGRVRLADGNIGKVSAQFGFPVQDATLQILDKTGSVVASKNLGSMQAGSSQIKWDGKDENGQKLSDGIYTVAIKGQGKSGSEIPGTIENKVRIEHLDFQDPNGMFATSLGKINLQDIGSLGMPTKIASQQAKPNETENLKKQQTEALNIKKAMEDAAATLQKQLNPAAKEPTAPKIEPDNAANPPIS